MTTNSSKSTEDRLTANGCVAAKDCVMATDCVMTSGYAAAKDNALQNRGLYVHIPFCASKCSYCDFYSVATDTDLAQKYIDEVCKEFSLFICKHPHTVIDTVYIGGGTPSVIDPRLITRLLEHIYKCANVDIKECTIEVNPCSASQEKLLQYKAAGIDRISVGVQTLNPFILKDIGRRHTPQEAIDTLRQAQAIICNVSADIMLGLPNQAVLDVQDSLDKVLPYCTHISQYMLKLSGEVPMGKGVACKKLTLPDDDTVADMYDVGYELMLKHSYKRYEISNFALDNYYSKHNLKYWDREQYIGIGAAAHSFIDGVRYDNPTDIRLYLAGNHMGGGKANAVRISKKDSLFEYIMLKLRTEQGFALQDINDRYNIDFVRLYAKQLHELQNLLIIANNRVRIRADKMLLESYVARRFL